MFKAELKAHRDRGWHSAKYLLMLPSDSFGSGTTMEEENTLDSIAVEKAKALRLTKEMRS